MRGAWGALVTLSSFVTVLILAASMVSDYIDCHGTIYLGGGAEVNMAMATASRMRSLIGLLQER